MAKAVKRNYINKHEFLKIVVEYNERVAQAKKDGTKLPIIPNPIGVAFMQISKKIGTVYKFRNYPFIEEMIADGYEDCCRQVHNFDPLKSQNPFGYFSRIVWNAFIRRIKVEKKQLTAKVVMTERCNLLNDTAQVQEGDERNYGINISQTSETLEYL